jgi:hypothetical protein
MTVRTGDAPVRTGCQNEWVRIAARIVYRYHSFVNHVSHFTLPNLSFS